MYSVTTLQSSILLLVLILLSSWSFAEKVTTDPLLLRATRGEAVERIPVWMMRQAGRHMKAYRDLVKEYPTFRERSETPKLSRDISLQPLQRYGVDGVILFSDILTPLPAMGIHFDISEGGKIQIDPIQTRKQFQKRLKRVTKADFCKKCSFVQTVLKELRQNVESSSPNTTIIGFVGLPFTLVSYLVEGKTGTVDGFPNIQKMIQESPHLLHEILLLLSDNIIQYACWQIECGAQVIQLFDSWAGHMNDKDYNQFCYPYQCRTVLMIKNTYPDKPLIIYIERRVRTVSVVDV